MSATRPLALAAVIALVVLAPVSSLAVTSPATTDGAGSVARPTEASVAADPIDITEPARERAERDRVQANESTEPAEQERGTALRFETRGYALRAVVETERNTTNYLDIPTREVQRDGFANASADVVGAIERDLAAVRSDYTTSSFDHAYEDASERQTVEGIRTEVERLESRISALRVRQERAIERYNVGDWSTERFLRELSTIDALARGIDERFEHLEDAVILPLPSNLKTEMQALKMELVSLSGPVRDDVGEAISGEREPFVTYTVTSADSVVTAYTGEQLFYREAFRGSNRAYTGANRFVSEDDPRGFSAADQRAKELYPWAYAYGGGGVDTFVNTTIYEVTLDNPHGTLDVYLDGRTTDAFREIQRKGLSLLPTTPRGNVSNGVRLTVNRTHATGPLQVAVAEDTGEPLNATVTVNGHRIGSTGSDGRLWTVTPYQQVRVVVETADGRRVTLSFFAD